MRICIPTADDSGRAARVFAHFGSAPCFTICDTEGGELTVLPNRNAHHAHGTCHPLGQLQDQRLGAVVTGGIGHRALQGLRAAGLVVYGHRPGATVADVLADLAAGTLRELDAAHACGGHGHGAQAHQAGHGRHGRG